MKSFVIRHWSFVIICILANVPASRAASGSYISQLPLTNGIGTNFLLGIFPALGTNDAWRIPVTALADGLYGTNAVRFTNECITTVIHGLDTNSSVAISNAGLAAVNAIYRTNLLNGYTQGIYKICFDTAYGSFVISNASAKVYGFDSLGATDIGDGVTWFDDFLGNPPAPTSWWGPINVTNCFTILVSSAGLAQPAISTNLYVSEIGNDTNALRGRIDRPYRNVQSALLASRPGDKVIVGPGLYPTPSYLGLNYYVSNRISLIGSGRGVTIIGSAGGTEQRLLCASEVVLRDLTFIGAVRMGAQEMGITATNCLIDACEILGTLDIVHIQNLEGVLTINNVKGSSSYDGIADFENRPGSSNRVIRITNSQLTVTNNAGGNTLRVIKGNDTRYEIFNSSLSLIGYAPNLLNTILYMDAEGTMTNHSGSILLSNVRIFRTATNGTALVATNFLNRTPIFMDNCTAFMTSPTLVSGSYSNAWYDKYIAFPNGASSARTNRLVDSRTLTNALVAANEQGHTVTIVDAGGTAAGSNVVIAVSGIDTITNSASQIAISKNFGSATLRLGPGKSWSIISISP